MGEKAYFSKSLHIISIIYAEEAEKMPEEKLEGMFREKEQAFIRECFRRGEKKMISGFEQIVIEERENAKQEGIKQGMLSEQERGIQVLTESCKKFGQTAETAIEIIIQNYSLSPEDARTLVARYWLQN